MPPRLKKLIGTIVLVIFVPAYALMAMAAAMALLPGWSGWAQGAYYVIAGLVWVLPAGLLISWMAKPPREP